MLNDIDYSDNQSRQDILKQLFGSVGEGVHVDIDFHCEYGKNIHIGDRSLINMNCTFVDNHRIDIGNDVLIASDVKIYTAYHSTRVSDRNMPNWDPSKSNCLTLAKPIKIEDSVWIGGGVVILPGVTIGQGSTIGAGSVVTRDIPANVVAVGNPCRVIKHIDQ